MSTEALVTRPGERDVWLCLWFGQCSFPYPSSIIIIEALTFVLIHHIQPVTLPDPDILQISCNQ